MKATKTVSRDNLHGSKPTTAAHILVTPSCCVELPGSHTSVLVLLNSVCLIVNESWNPGVLCCVSQGNLVPNNS
jgi:hypothetical protein